MASTVLLVAALCAFFIGAIPAANPVWNRVNFIALGLFFWVLSILIGDAHALLR